MFELQKSRYKANPNAAAEFAQTQAIDGRSY